MNERKIKKRFVVVAAISRVFHKYGWKIFIILLIVLCVALFLSANAQTNARIEEMNRNTFMGVLGRMGNGVSGFFGRIGNGIAGIGKDIASGAKNAWGFVTGLFH